MKKKETKCTKEDIIAEYILHCKISELSDATLRNYRYDLDLIFRKYDTISKESIEDYLLKLSDQNMSSESKKHYIRCLKTFTVWCAEEGYLEKMKLPVIKAQEPAVKLYTVDECRKLISKEKNETFAQYRTRIMIAFILATGCRARTILNIKLSDVNFENHTVLFRELKNKTTYQCPMIASIEKELRKYISTWELPNDGYLFCNESGKQLEYSSFRHAFDRRCNRLKVNKRGIHAIRHTFASNYIQNGGDVFSLSRQLTHKSIRITENYIHLLDRDIAKKVQQYNSLDKILNEKTTIRRRQNSFE